MMVKLKVCPLAILQMVVSFSQFNLKCHLHTAQEKCNLLKVQNDTEANDTFGLTLLYGVHVVAVDELRIVQHHS